MAAGLFCRIRFAFSSPSGLMMPGTPHVVPGHVQVPHNGSDRVQRRLLRFEPLAVDDRHPRHFAHQPRADGVPEVGFQIPPVAQHMAARDRPFRIRLVRHCLQQVRQPPHPGEHVLDSLGAAAAAEGPLLEQVPFALVPDHRCHAHEGAAQDAGRHGVPAYYRQVQPAGLQAKVEGVGQGAGPEVEAQAGVRVPADPGQARHARGLLPEPGLEGPERVRVGYPAVGAHQPFCLGPQGGDSCRRAVKLHGGIVLPFTLRGGRPPGAVTTATCRG